MSWQTAITFNNNAVFCHYNSVSVEFVRPLSLSFTWCMYCSALQSLYTVLHSKYEPLSCHPVVIRMTYQHKAIYLLKYLLYTCSVQLYVTARCLRSISVFSGVCLTLLLLYLMFVSDLFYYKGISFPCDVVSQGDLTLKFAWGSHKLYYYFF